MNQNELLWLIDEKMLDVKIAQAGVKKATLELFEVIETIEKLRRSESIKRGLRKSNQERKGENEDKRN